MVRRATVNSSRAPGPSLAVMASRERLTSPMASYTPQFSNVARPDTATQTISGISVETTGLSAATSSMRSMDDWYQAALTSSSARLMTAGSTRMAVSVRKAILTCPVMLCPFFGCFTVSTPAARDRSGRQTR